MRRFRLFIRTPLGLLYGNGGEELLGCRVAEFQAAHPATQQPCKPMTSSSQTILLRTAAFLVDALCFSVLLVLPASIVSYSLAWVGGAIKAIQLVWFVALGIVAAAMLLRDGYKGRSLGKRMLGLRIMT